MSDSKFLLLFAIFVFVMSFTSTTIGRKHRSRDCCCRPKKHCKNACEEEDDNEQTSPSPTPNEQICYINCYDGLTGTKTNNSVGVSYTGPYNSAICECGLSDYRCNASANGPLCGPFRDCRCYVGKMYAQCAFVQTPKQIQSVLIGCPHGRIPPPPQKIPPEPTPLPKSIYSYRCDWPGIGSMNYSPETATGCRCMGEDTRFNATAWFCHCYGATTSTLCSFNADPNNFLKVIGYTTPPSKTSTTLRIDGK